MSTEEDRADISVYDLAKRVASGLKQSEAANQEVAAELLRVKAELSTIFIMFITGREPGGEKRLVHLGKSMGLP